MRREVELLFDSIVREDRKRTGFVHTRITPMSTRFSLSITGFRTSWATGFDALS